MKTGKINPSVSPFLERERAASTKYSIIINTFSAYSYKEEIK
jgi:hypothetical protein